MPIITSSQDLKWLPVPGMGIEIAALAYVLTGERGIVNPFDCLPLTKHFGVKSFSHAQMYEFVTSYPTIAKSFFVGDYARNMNNCEYNGNTWVTSTVAFSSRKMNQEGRALDLENEIFLYDNLLNESTFINNVPWKRPFDDEVGTKVSVSLKIPDQMWGKLCFVELEHCHFRRKDLHITISPAKNHIVVLNYPNIETGKTYQAHPISKYPLPSQERNMHYAIQISSPKKKFFGFAHWHNPWATPRELYLDRIDGFDNMIVYRPLGNSIVNELRKRYALGMKHLEQFSRSLRSY